MAATSVTNLMRAPRVVCWPLSARAHENISVADFAQYSPAQLRPIRSAPIRRGKESFVGRWWFASTRQHVGFASLAERDVLMVVDFAGDVVEIQRDPMLMLPARDEQTPLPHPWLFVRNADDSRLLMVHGGHPTATLLAAVFASTPISIGSGIQPSLEENRTIGWLSGYRFTRFRVPMTVEREALELCSVPRTISELTAFLAGQLRDSSSGLAAIYALLWHRMLVLDTLHSPPSSSSLVVAA